MRKADSDKVVTILIVALLLTAVFIYGGKQFANSVFKTECTFNKVIPAATVDFGNGIKVSVSSERRYGQDFVIRVMTLRDDGGDLICGFDNGTNRGELYLRFEK